MRGRDRQVVPGLFQWTGDPDNPPEYAFVGGAFDRLFQEVHDQTRLFEEMQGGTVTVTDAGEVLALMKLDDEGRDVNNPFVIFRPVRSR